MNRTELLQAMKDCYAANLPLFILGPPGIGKTDLVEYFANENNVEFHSFNSATLDPSSFGITTPRIDNSACDIVPTAEFVDPKEGSVFFYDEIDKIEELIQNTLLPLVQNNRLHSRKLNKRWNVFAGNRAQDSKASHAISPILKGRGVTVEYDGPTLNEWLEYAMAHSADYRIMAFLKEKPHYLNAYDANADASPTHRQWMNVNKIINSPVRPFLTKGLIGAKAAADFEVYIKLTSRIPDFNALLIMTGYTLPDDFVLRSLLAMMIAAKLDGTNAPKLKYIIDQFSPEFIVMIFKQAQSRPNNNLGPFIMQNGYFNQLNQALYG